MTEFPQAFARRLLSADDLDAVRPLWEQLRAHHARLPWPFAGEMHRFDFAARKQELLAKAAGGKLRIELVSTAPAGVDIAYCISTVSAHGGGEVDSLFVEEGFRGRGIGSALVRQALAWLESAGATTTVVSVACANQEALALYQRFGFHPRTVLLQQLPDHAT